MTGEVQDRTVLAARAAAAAALALAVLVVARPGSPEPDFGDPLQYVQDGLFTAYLLAASGALVLAARAGLVSRVASRLVAVGYGMLVVGVVAGMVLREDPEWFAVLGGPGNLLAGIGFVVLAVTAARRRTLPVPLAVLGGVGGFFAVLMAEFGSGVLVAAFFALLARHAAADAPEVEDRAGYAPSIRSR